MKRLLARVAAFVLLASTLVSAQAYVVFQQALSKERASGRLDEAIKLYRTIVADPAADRTIKAKALLQIGGCYERLGSADAPKTYQQLIREFGDQTETVKLARERLADIADVAADRARPKTAEPATRAIALPAAGRPSPDGRRVAYRDRGALVIREEGSETRVVARPAGSDEVTSDMAWSHDGLQIAYTLAHTTGQNRAPAQFELHIVAVDGSGDRIIIPRGDSQPMTFDWSRDNRHLLVFFESKPTSTSNELALVSLADGAVSALKHGNADEWRPDRGAFSTDGRYVAYSVANERTGSDVMLIATDGSSEKPIVQHSSEDVFVAWTPNGKSILFTSDRAGTTDLWLVHVAKGAATDLPQKIARNIGDIEALVLTSSGALVYRLRTAIERRDVLVASLDPNTGRITSAPSSVTTNGSDQNFAPVWSPDGRALAYITKGQPVITIATLDSGEERRLAIKLESGSSPYSIAWSPDGRHFLADSSPDAAPVGKPGLFIIDAHTGETRKVATEQPDRSVTESKWLPGRKTAVYEHYWHAIVEKDLESGSERTIYEVDRGRKLTSLTVSPDGSQIAFREWQNATYTSALMTMKLTDRAPATMAPLHGPANNGLAEACCISWAPDGRHLIYADQTGGKTEWELWRISLTGGPPERLGAVGGERYRFFSIHPDGTRMAFGVIYVDRPAGAYVLEHFLPPVEVR